MCSCLRGVSRWFTPLACGPGSQELTKSYMDMASKLFTFTTQAVAATTGIRLDGNAASNTASAWSVPEHTRTRRMVSATELSRPGYTGSETADAQCGAVCVP